MTPAKIALAWSLMNVPNLRRRSDLDVGIGCGQINASALGTLEPLVPVVTKASEVHDVHSR
jgi:hypothetical protein